MTARSLVGGSNVIKGSGYRPDAAAMFLELAKFASLLLSILSLDAVFHATLLRLSSIGGLILAVTLIAAWFVNRDISTSLGDLKAAMRDLG